MEFVSKDFEGLLLNIFQHRIGTDLFKVFPVLSKYEEFTVNVPHIKKENLLRYIIYAFDKNSPLAAINDILERRVEALKLAGFTPHGTTHKWAHGLDRMVKSLNPKVNHAIIRYCMLQGDTDYTVLVTYEDSLLKELDRLINFDAGEEDDSGEKKKELIANINTLRKDINTLKQEFFANNVDLFLLRSLSEFAESKKILLSPEYYAEILKGWDNVSRYYNNVNLIVPRKRKRDG